MSQSSLVLAPDAIARTRSNHSLEHATVALLMERLGTGIRLLGRSTANGFYLHADLPTEAVEATAREALRRLQQGEVELAISPFCGTNYATAGLLAGLGAIVAIGRGNRLLRLPQVFLASLLGVLVGFPLGRWVQRHFTTSSDLSGLQIVSVQRFRWSWPVTHYVETAWEVPWEQEVGGPVAPSPTRL